MWKPTMKTSQSGVLHRKLEHLVGVVFDRILGDADVLDLALRLLLEAARVRSSPGHGGIGRVNAVQIEHVDVVGAHRAQGIVQTRHHALGRPPFVGAMIEGLGGDHHRMPRDGS